MTNIFDLIVVGGGPAGSSAAFEAARRGINVALIEKEKRIAETVRTSGVTWIQDMNEFGIPKYCMNPIKNYSFVSPNNMVTINSSTPMAAVLDVRRTYRWLAQQAKENGAKIFLNSTVNDVIKNDQGDIAGVKCTQGDKNITFQSKMVIDASGFPSVISKAMNFVTQWKKFGVGAEYEARVENADIDTWWLMVGQKYSPAGYAWIFPVREGVVRIGVGVSKPDSVIDPTERLKDLLKSREGPIKNLGKITPIEFHYGLIPNDGLVRKTVHNNLILVGDSAGQANPLVLEGIRYAIRFGRVAGRISATAIKNNQTDKDALYPYEDIWKKEIQKKLSAAGKVQNRWIGLTDKKWDEELDVIKELKIDEFLDFIRADFDLTSMIKMATRHPKLAVRQLFSLVK